MSVELRWKTSFLLALATALGWMAYSLIGAFGSGKQALLQEELNQILNENRLLERKNRNLAAEAKALRDRTDYIEKVAREELGLVKSNEIVFHFPEDEYTQTPSEHPGQSLQPSDQAKHGKKTKAGRKARGD